MFGPIHLLQVPAPAQSSRKSHRWDLPVLRISTQTESMASEFKKGHSDGARDMPVCSGSTGVMLNPLSCGWRAVGMLLCGHKACGFWWLAGAGLLQEVSFSS